MTQFDAIIIGAGQAGPALAGRLTAAGMTVAFVERKLFGGTCVNTGCMPTKTLIASARAAHVARRGADFGFVAGPVAVDMPRVKARVNKVIDDARAGVESWVRGLPGCTVIKGHARLESPTSVRVGDQLLKAPRIFLNVGGRASVPPIPGIDGTPYLDNVSILARDELPDHLIILGGSYIGLEFAQMYRRFGAEVTVIERAPHLVAHEDQDVSDAIRDILTGEGIVVHTDGGVARVAPHERGVAVDVHTRQGDQTFVGAHLLLATGRRPNTEDLGLEAAGVATDARGNIPVDVFLATHLPGIWALGDCNGRGAFTHTAYNDYEILANNLLDAPQGAPRRRLSQRILGYALYIDPPLGRVGMSERDARAAGRPLLVGRRPMTRVGRAVEKGETQGFMKIVVDAETKKILGAAILGVGGDEAIHGLLDAMNADLPYDVIKWAMPIHPTVSELIPTVLGEMRPA
jgi:pyruvate/2-oxoglutarate dehydrogenase complex dihydrolipoamide dehydrogenase (E3) component